MNPYNPYFFNGNNYPNFMNPQLNRLNQLENQYQGYNNQSINPNMMPNINSNIQNQILQGKAVDSIEVVKAMDVPLDGSITYFPKTDGSAIYTKQLQADGTSRINTYELNINSGNMPSIYPNNGVNKEDISKIYSDISEVKNSLKSDLESIHNEVSNLLMRFEELRDDLKYTEANVSNRVIGSNTKSKGAK